MDKPKERGMSLIDAIKSGRPFREHPGQSWMVMDPEGRFCWDDGKFRKSPTRSDCLADYQIQELTVTITKAQFWEAASIVTEEWSLRALEIMAIKLGLGEPP